MHLQRSLPTMPPARLRQLAVWVCLLSFLASPPGALTDELPWRWSNPQPHGNNVYDLAFDQSTYWQVGDRGRIYTSTDRLTWTPLASGTTRSLRGLAFLGSQTVISGENGTLLLGTQAGGFVPATVNPATTDWLEGVAASATTLVAVGDNAAIYVSTDAGAHWQRVTGLTFTDWLRGVAYGGGTFVTVGENGLIATSPNGTTWRKRTSGVTSALNRVTYTSTSNTFTAVGDSGVLLTSVNQGTNWIRESTGVTNALYTYAQTGVRRLVGGESTLRLKSTLLGAWEDQLGGDTPLPAPTWDYYGSLWDGSRFFVAGRTGMMVESFVTNTITGVLWLEESASPRDWLWDVLGLPRQFIAVGDRAQVMTSENGATWFSETVPTALTNAVFLAVGGSTNRVVAAGSDGALMVSDRTLTNVITTNTVVSFTGCVWSTNTVVATNAVNLLGLRWNPALPAPTTNTLQGVCEREGLFVVVGDLGTVLTSSNGTKWTRLTLAGQPHLSSVAAAPGAFVATGPAGTIVSSPDAVTWTPRTSGTTNWIYRVRFAQDHFVAVGQNGTLLTSPDGTAWTPQASGSSAWLTDVTVAGNRRFVCGTQGTVLVSSNLSTWSPVTGISSKSLYGLAARGTQLLAVGVEGVILRALVDPSTPITFAAYTQESCIQTRVDRFTFRGRTDQRFALESSPDLATWQRLAEFEFEFDELEEVLVRTNLAPAAAEYFRAAPASP
jgi:hypothetical protein